MLHVKETSVPRARFPVIDFHTHVVATPGPAAGRAACGIGQDNGCRQPPHHGQPDRWARCRTGAGDQGVRRRVSAPVRQLDGAVRGTGRTSRAIRRGRPRNRQARKKPAHVGLKVLKTLGLYLRESGATGRLVRDGRSAVRSHVGDVRPLDMPVAIHIGDPEAFFLPIGSLQRAIRGARAHPDWSFYGSDFPRVQGNAGRARSRLRAASEDHVGRLARGASRRGSGGRVRDARSLSPNVHVEIAARIGELGRQPRASRALLRHDTRIGSCSAPTRCRTATRRRSRCSVTDAVPDLLPVPRDRGRVFRLCAGAGAAAGPVADLRARAAGTDPEEGVLRECGAGIGDEARLGVRDRRSIHRGS